MSTPATSQESSRRILEIAAQHHGVVSRKDLCEAGFTRGFIRGRVEAAWLLPLHRGVYAVGHPLESETAVLAAALLAAGPDSFVAGRSAAALWGIHRSNGPIEVVRRKSRAAPDFWLEPPGLARPRAVRVRRSTRLDPGDLSSHHGLRTTGVERTLLDLAGTLDSRGLRAAFNEADRLGLLHRDRLLECAGRGQGWVGAPGFRRLVETRHPETQISESELESMFMDLCRRHGIRVPESNPVLCGYRVDCLWRRERLVVELDGFEFHRGRMAFERDATRDAELRLAGYTVLRITYGMVVNRSGQTARLVISQLAQAPAPSRGDPRNRGRLTRQSDDPPG